MTTLTNRDIENLNAILHTYATTTRTTKVGGKHITRFQVKHLIITLDHVTPRIRWNEREIRTVAELNTMINSYFNI